MGHRRTDTKKKLPANTNGASVAPGQLVDGNNLLKIIFPAQCRPTLRWLRDQQKARGIPFCKIGRLVSFDPANVREVLNAQRTVKFGSAQ
jgi:hypothetical protein